MLSLSWIIVVDILTIGKQQPGVPRGRPTNKERALRAARIAAKRVTVDVAAAAHLQTRAQVFWNLHQLRPRIYVYHLAGTMSLQDCSSWLESDEESDESILNQDPFS